MDFYTDQDAQQTALDSLASMLDSGVPPEWIIGKVEEARTEYLCYRVLVEAGLLELEALPTEE